MFGIISNPARKSLGINVIPCYIMNIWLVTSICYICWFESYHCLFESATCWNASCPCQILAAGGFFISTIITNALICFLFDMCIVGIPMSHTNALLCNLKLVLLDQFCRSRLDKIQRQQYEITEVKYIQHIMPTIVYATSYSNCLGLASSLAKFPRAIQGLHCH